MARRPATPGPRNSITDVEGVLVGQWTRLGAATMGSGWATGATVVLTPAGATASVDVRGGGPGTRETDLLAPHNTVQHVHGIALAGGSAFGLAAADGVMQWLEQQGHGLRMGSDGAVVPIVPAAVIFDLPVGGWANRPGAAAGHAAAEKAGRDVETGSVGAGTGARAGALKGGVGTASLCLGAGPAEGLTVGALVVANPVGSVIDPETGLPWGLLAGIGDEFAAPIPTAEQIAALRELGAKGTVLNTTIGVVATDATLDKAGCHRLAVAGQAGLARAIRPSHSPLDGDTIFAVATGTAALPPGVTAALPAGIPGGTAVLAELAAAAASCVERAIVHAVLAAVPVAGIPAYTTMVAGTATDTGGDHDLQP
ncbi:P1 family peptidase [Lolliginicoccus levis]|uniref:P1 family peptidase n=1 Tax=Lolliginicoccus levis TaxID=2919542 RepID=UPI00241E8CA6|nr:P1 family peptidase [Lolliginicoccus levis]